MRYVVTMKNTIYMSVVVEAEDLEDALEQADKEGLPGVMLLDHRYPDEDGWESIEANEDDQS